MTQTLTPAASPGPSHRRPPRSGDGFRMVMRGIGQTLITCGFIVALYLVYEVWITNIWADQNNEHNINALKKEYDTVLGLPGGGASTLPIGQGIGILYIPRLGRDYAEAIVQGAKIPDDDQLEQGTAHYGTTQLPGQVGNFAIAGHRVGKGEPFLNLDQLRSGDKVIVETKSTWFVYQVLGSPAGGDPETDASSTVTYKGGSEQLHGRQIIDPSQGQVTFPVPNRTDLGLDSATEKLMTMTTCHPKFTASHRMIIFSRLVTQVPAVANSDTSKASDMPAAIAALYNQVGS